MGLVLARGAATAGEKEDGEEAGGCPERKGA
jgi:hypothetical protein